MKMYQKQREPQNSLLNQASTNYYRSIKKHDDGDVILLIYFNNQHIITFIHIYIF